jgi:hypothetical protein
LSAAAAASCLCVTFSRSTSLFVLLFRFWGYAVHAEKREEGIRRK